MIRAGLKIVLALSMLLVLLLAGGFAFLQTGKGKQWLAKTISHFASTQDRVITVNGITGHIPEDIHINVISLADRQGVYTELHGLHLAWHPLPLIRKSWRIETLEAEHIIVYRQPAAQPQQSGGKGFSLKDLPDITIASLKIPMVTLEKPVTGVAQEYSMQGSITPHHYGLKVTTLEGPRTTLDLKLSTESNRLNAAFMLDEEAHGLIGTLAQLPPASGLHAEFQATTDDLDHIHIQDARITTGLGSVNAMMDYRLASGETAADISVTGLDIEQLPGMGGNAKGTADAKILLTGTLEGLKTVITFHSSGLVVSGRQLKDAHIQSDMIVNTARTSLQGHIMAGLGVEETPVSLESDIHLENRQLTLDKLKIIYGVAQAGGKVTADMAMCQWSADLKSEPVPLHLIAPDSRMEGDIAASLAAKGSFSHFDAVTELQFNSPQGNSLLSLKNAMDTSPLKTEGTLEGTFARSGHTFTLSSTLKASKAEVELNNILVKGDGLKLSGNINYAIQTQLAGTSLDFAIPSLQPVGKLFGQDIQGQAKGHIYLSSRDNHQLADITTLLQGIKFRDLEIRQLDLRAGYDNRDKATDIRLAQLDGHYAAMPFTLPSPAKIMVKDTQATIQAMKMRLAGGTAAVTGFISPEKLDLHLLADHITLQQLPVKTAIQGIVNGEMTVAGSPKQPHMALKVQGELEQSGYPLLVRAEAKIADHKASLHANASTRAAGKASDAVMKADITLPLNLSLLPFHLELPKDSAVQGSLVLNTPLDGLNLFLRDKDQRVHGTLAGNMQAGGTVNAPLVSGTFTLANMQYDYSQTSFCLKNMQASVKADADHISLEALHAAADNGGTLTASGHLALKDKAAVSGEMVFSDLHLFCGGIASGAVGGTLKLGATPSRQLAGTLVFSPLNVQIPESTARSAIPQVKTVSIHGNKPEPAITNTAAKAQAPFDLNIQLKVPNRLFVRGRGLDAEFAGNLAITGAATAPAVNGQLTVVHGKFTLLDRILKIDSGTITFNGPMPPSPFLDVQAESTVKATLVKAGLTGSAANPELSFSSEPSLPHDEILALLLFGRDLSSLTPFQVVQLAQSIAELSGHGGGPGALDKVRSFLGIDTLDVGTDTNNDVTVGTGKYITDKIYVGVTQGVKPESRALTTEVEVLPHVSADTSVSAGGQQGLGLQWKYDY